MFFYIFSKISGDRYFLDGKIKIPKSDIDTLKGMNQNYLTSGKEMDYRFVSRLLSVVYTKKELLAGCVRIDEKYENSKYTQLDKVKFDFVRGLLFT